MSETENLYVKRITDADKQKIINSSVAALPDRPTLNATEMKMRFVEPIVKSDADSHCLADEVDRVANEANDEFDRLNKQADTFSKDIEDLKDENVAQSGAIGAANSNIDRIETQVTEEIAAVRKVAERAESMAYNVDTGLSVVYSSAAEKIVASIDDSTFVMTIEMFDRQNNFMSSTQIDLPLESVVVGGKFDESTKSVMLTLKNGGTVSFSVADLVDGLISSSEKGVANGVPSLDANGKVPKEQLPDDIGSGGGVSEERVGELIDEKIGNIETALDSVISLQNSLIGGSV